MAAFIGFARSRVNERLVSSGDGIDWGQFRQKNQRRLAIESRMQMYILKLKTLRASVTGAKNATVNQRPI